MCSDQSLRALVAANLAHDHGYVFDLSLAEAGDERLGRAHSLQQQRHSLRGGPLQRIGEVVGRIGDQLLPGGHDEVEPKPAAIIEKCREGGTRVGDERDAPGFEVGGESVAAGP
jgi:hypothetical protein